MLENVPFYTLADVSLRPSDRQIPITHTCQSQPKKRQKFGWKSALIMYLTGTLSDPGLCALCKKALLWKSGHQFKTRGYLVAVGPCGIVNIAGSCVWVSHRLPFCWTCKLCCCCRKCSCQSTQGSSRRTNPVSIACMPGESEKSHSRSF